MYSMMQLKFKIRDTVDNVWHKTKYNRQTGELHELFISQNGEIWEHKIDATGKAIITHEKNFSDPKRFVIVQYTGAKDKEGRKYYYNDIVCFTSKDGNKSYGVLVWMGDKLAIGSGPIDDYTAIDEVNERQLRDAECVGNIYDDPQIIMG